MVESWEQQNAVWGLCRRSKWVRMAKCMYYFDQMGQNVYTEGVGRESRKKAKKAQDPRVTE